MTQIYEEQSESDEDCEIYFLKPVNEYNIVDKIKEANKELFADAALTPKNNCDTAESESESTINISTSTLTTTTTTTTTTTKITTMRKVTFAANLEDYEPESSKKTDSDPDQFFPEDDLPHTAPKSELTKFPTIDEEEQIAILEELVNEKNNANESMANSDEQTQLAVIVQSRINKNSQPLESDSAYLSIGDEEIDDICEEIIVMQMESSTSTAMATLALPKDDSFSAQHRRAILKQTTFDCDEQDNKSLMNLLTASDCEEDESRSTIKYTYENNDDDDDEDANDSSIFIGIDDFEDEENADDDDDDGDKLSVIVASYLPDDFESAIAISPTSPSRANSVAKSRSYFRSNSNKALTPCKSSSTSFSKRFQLRRKARSTNSIGTVSSGIGGTSNTIHDESRKKEEFIGLKLNYKTCCEYRNAIQGKLPKYTGYLSEYGLSREQLQQREHKLQTKQRFVLEQTIKTNEHEMQKMQDNERAFTTWLRNKMRFPINKTRNMFDVKFKFTGRKKSSTGNSTNGNGNTGCAAKFKIK